MGKYKPQHNRLLFIDKKISEGKHPNCTSLAQEWEGVSAKTIQRDLDYMRYQLDAPIDYSAKERGYFYTEANFHLPAISIKESDLFAIYLAEELLEQYKDTPLYDRLSSVYKKIEDSLPVNALPQTELPHARFTVFSPPSTSIQPKIWDTIFESVRTKTQLEIVYQPPGQEPAKRLLDPYHALRYDGDWYVTGLCHERTQIRTFSLSRIRKVTPQKEHFTIPTSFDFKKITGSRFGIHWGGDEQQVEIMFSSKTAPYIIERNWHPSQNITLNPDGTIQLQLTVNHTLELKRWILSWGKDAEVIKPQKLRDEIQEEMLASLSLYNNSIA